MRPWRSVSVPSIMVSLGTTRNRARRVRLTPSTRSRTASANLPRALDHGPSPSTASSLRVYALSADSTCWMAAALVGRTRHVHGQLLILAPKIQPNVTFGMFRARIFMDTDRCRRHSVIVILSRQLRDTMCQLCEVKHAASLGLRRLRHLM